MESLYAYIPTDRRYALAHGSALPDRTAGAALFADISGFTPLTEALVLALGPQRGAEELTGWLNKIYDALVTQIESYRGSVISFSGDAMTCWFDDQAQEYITPHPNTSSVLRATACALAIQLGASFVARSFSGDPKQLKAILKAAISHSSHTSDTVHIALCENGAKNDISTPNSNPGMSARTAKPASLPNR